LKAKALKGFQNLEKINILTVGALNATAEARKQGTYKECKWQLVPEGTALNWSGFGEKKDKSNVEV